ncbi:MULTISPECIES: hypothetical protein [Acinetobacter]|jgi:hypothetical protein|uniref:hypothetical protein n=1 Tax=Acinetobacter TaxID=469 RepID=UPI00103F89BF|nr:MULTISPECIES: hypothetical protein [Acinetobacter]MCO8056111.1 hypothetical protein [Acinetobacter towneri]MDM1282147.1 hypothetical protein [Acinetobacter towneri]TCB17363.1 hypothetical protein E0H79_08965 [Acinetobacter sp. ANC 5045]HHW53359.1 hypothetical protein [Acinetobacter towneri]
MKTLKLFAAITMCFSIFGSTQVIADDSPNTALAVCWETNSGKYQCDGPTQRLSTSYTTLSEALSLSGCSTGRAVQTNYLTHARTGRQYATVYTCNYTLKPGNTASYTTNRDVRGWWDGIIY